MSMNKKIVAGVVFGVLATALGAVSDHGDARAAKGDHAAAPAGRWTHVIGTAALYEDAACKRAVKFFNEGHKVYIANSYEVKACGGRMAFIHDEHGNSGMIGCNQVHGGC